MAARKPPESWYWSHDIKPNQLGSVVMPGMRLVRLSSYGQGDARRFAALLYKEPGPARSYALDLDASAVVARLADHAARPVAITASGGAGESRRFSLVFDPAPGPLATVHVDLDAQALRAVAAERGRIVDIATYLVDGDRRFSVVVEDAAGPTPVFVGVSALELDAKLVEQGARLIRLRAYAERGRTVFAAVAEPAGTGRWAWYSDLDGDAVARNLENNQSYPVDLDAGRDERGVRFTVIMARER